MMLTVYYLYKERALQASACTPKVSRATSNLIWLPSSQLFQTFFFLGGGDCLVSNFMTDNRCLCLSCVQPRRYTAKPELQCCCRFQVCRWSNSAGNKTANQINNTFFSHCQSTYWCINGENNWESTALPTVVTTAKAYFFYFPGNFITSFLWLLLFGYFFAISLQV